MINPDKFDELYNQKNTLAAVHLNPNAAIARYATP